MIQTRGQDHRSMLTGGSTHSQRIERLWADMYCSVTVVYYQLFYYLEQHELLDVLNEVQLYALHFVYLPRINQSLRLFQEGWNHHGIWTAHHLSPQQLFLQGLLRFSHQILWLKIFLIALVVSTESATMTQFLLMNQIVLQFQRVVFQS